MITRISQWERSDWGGGGEEFHWWCTEAPEAFSSKTRVIDSMAEELIAMVGQGVYDKVLAYVDGRAAQPTSTRSRTRWCGEGLALRGERVLFGEGRARQRTRISS